MSHYMPYPAYKDSGVDWAPEIPVHWDVKRLRFVASLNPLPAWKDLEGQGADCPFLPMEAIGEAGELDTTRRKPIGECRSGYTYFAEGDVAYAKVTPCFENGKGAVMRGLEGGHGFGTTELTVLRPISIDRDYLYALTFAESFRQPGAAEMLGTGGLKRVPDEFARNYRAALPPREEQSAITAAIDRETSSIDALIAKKTRFIELLQEKRQALITHAVTKGLAPNVKLKDSGVGWIGEVPEHWEIVPSAWLFAEGKERAHADDEHLSATQKYGVIPLAEYERLEERQVTHATMNLEQRKHVELGDFVISMRSFEGGIERVKARGCVRSSYVVLHAEAGVNVDFFAYLFKSSRYIQGLQATSSFIRDGQDLSYGNFRQVKLPLPGVEEQCNIARVIGKTVGRIDMLTAATQRSIDLLKERRSAFITAAVTGQIDLREAA